MILYKDYVTFNILGKNVNLICQDEKSWLHNYLYVTAEIDDGILYLGEMDVTVKTAIFAYEKFFDKVLSPEEIKQVIFLNKKQKGNIMTTKTQTTKKTTSKTSTKTTGKKSTAKTVTGKKTTTKKTSTKTTGSRTTAKKATTKKPTVKKTTTKKTTAKKTNSKKPATKTSSKKTVPASKAVVDKTGVVTVTSK